MDSTNAHELFTTLENLVKLYELRKPLTGRIWAMMSLRRMVNHTKDKTYLGLHKAPLGQWCLQSLNSSLREVRIAAT